MDSVQSKAACLIDEVLPVVHVKRLARFRVKPRESHPKYLRFGFPRTDLVGENEIFDFTDDRKIPVGRLEKYGNP